MNKRGPKPTVWYDGSIYSCRSYTVEIPDLETMPRLDVLVWLMQNTTKRCHSTKPPQVNLPGIQLVVR
jgi:hypothetical protein